MTNKFGAAATKGYLCRHHHLICNVKLKKVDFMKKTKRIMVTVVLLAMVIGANAQGTTSENDSTIRMQTVFLESGAASNGIGLNYERRLKSDPRWGWRAGVAWGYGMEWISHVYSSSERIYTGSLGMNYLLGQKRSKLELGAGVSAGLYNSHFDIKYYGVSKENKFGYYLYGNIGYRYQARNGFQFRAGWSPVTGLGTKHGLKSQADVFYLSVGWSF